MATLVVQRIEFKELKIIVNDGRSRPNHGAVGLAHQPPRARSDTVYLETDQLLEEKPTRFQCRNPQQLVSQQGLTVEERLVFANRYGGTLQVSFVVLPSGIYDPLTFRRERGPASDMENMLKQQAEACLYLPGRIDGVPVSVRVYGYPGDIINLSR